MPSFFETINKKFNSNPNYSKENTTLNYNTKFIRPLPTIPEMDPIKKYAPEFKSLPNYITYPHPEDKYFSKDTVYPKGILYPKILNDEKIKNILNLSEDKNIQVKKKEEPDNTFVYLIIALIVGYLVCKKN